MDEGALVPLLNDVLRKEITCVRLLKVRHAELMQPLEETFEVVTGKEIVGFGIRVNMAEIQLRINLLEQLAQ